MAQHFVHLFFDLFSRFFPLTHILHFIRQFAAISFFFHVSFLFSVAIFHVRLDYMHAFGMMVGSGVKKHVYIHATHTRPPTFISSAHMNFIPFAYSLDVHNLLDAIIMQQK